MIPNGFPGYVCVCVCGEREDHTVHAVICKFKENSVYELTIILFKFLFQKKTSLFLLLIKIIHSL